MAQKVEGVRKTELVEAELPEGSFEREVSGEALPADRLDERGGRDGLAVEVEGGGGGGVRRRRPDEPDGVEGQARGG